MFLKKKNHIIKKKNIFFIIIAILLLIIFTIFFYYIIKIILIKNNKNNFIIEKKHILIKKNDANISIYYPITKNIIINEKIKNFIDKEYEKFEKKYLIKNNIKKKDYILSYSINNSKKNIFSIVFINTIFINNKKKEYIDAMAFDLNTSNKININNLLENEKNEENIINELSNKSLEFFKKKKQLLYNSHNEEIKFRTLPKIENFSNFTINKKNLIIYIELNKNNTTDFENWDFDNHHIEKIIIPIKKIPKIILNFSLISNEKKEIISNSEIREKKKINFFKNKKKIALTFDDGPHQILTLKILEILKEKKILGTFFVIGELVEKTPNIAKKIYDEGHQIGNHSYTHKNFNLLTTNNQIKEINITNEILKKYVNSEENFLFRPPYGNINLKIIKNIKTPIILWSLDSKDWKLKKEEKIYENIIKDIKNNEIILFHDIYNETINILPKIIDYLKKNNYIFTTIEQLLELNENNNNFIYNFEQ